MKDDFEQYTVKDFREAVEKLGDDIYSQKIGKKKADTNIFIVANNYLLITVNMDQIQ